MQPSQCAGTSSSDARITPTAVSRCSVRSFGKGKNVTRVILRNRNHATHNVLAGSSVLTTAKQRTRSVGATNLTATLKESRRRKGVRTATGFANHAEATCSVDATRESGAASTRTPKAPTPALDGACCSVRNVSCHLCNAATPSSTTKGATRRRAVANGYRVKGARKGCGSSSGTASCLENNPLVTSGGSRSGSTRGR